MATIRKRIEHFDAKRRLLTDVELRQVIACLYQVREVTTNPIIKTADEFEVRQNLNELARLGQVVVVTDSTSGALIGIIVFDACKYWFSKELILVEHHILRCNPDYIGFGKLAVKLLEALAIQFKCRYIASGNMVSDTKVTNLYRKNGFESFNAFYKEVSPLG